MTTFILVLRADAVVSQTFEHMLVIESRLQNLPRWTVKKEQEKKMERAALLSLKAAFFHVSLPCKWRGSREKVTPGREKETKCPDEKE